MWFWIYYELEYEFKSKLINVPHRIGLAPISDGETKLIHRAT